MTATAASAGTANETAPARAGFEATAAVAVGRDGIVLVGNDVSDGIGGVAGWIVAFSLDGQVRWQRRLALPGVPTSWYDDLAVTRSTTAERSMSSGRPLPAGTTARTELPPSRPEDVVVR